MSRSVFEFSSEAKILEVRNKASESVSELRLSNLSLNMADEIVGLQEKLRKSKSEKDSLEIIKRILDMLFPDGWRETLGGMPIGKLTEFVSYAFEEAMREEIRSEPEKKSESGELTTS